ncbi:hypothetical protein BLNAU_2311 [Blattamonas nauphoetae]|uniref:Uncharacterized protein n=1 Tax=Blattamonas nauphoetae TaxID=2049346 RepID=A0ABQ9YGJ9_9EUKA|nr:hypothetical protein BLNAU_2311 [Blattamonas nauphoetae]
MWATSSRSGPIEKSGSSVAQPLAGGDHDIRSRWCTQSSSTYKWNKPMTERKLHHSTAHHTFPIKREFREFKDEEEPFDQERSYTPVMSRSMKSANDTRGSQTAPAIQRFSTGFSTNNPSHFKPPGYDPTPRPRALHPNLQQAAKVSRRLELEGDVFGSMSRTTYTKPPVPQPDAPEGVSMEPSGYSKNATCFYADELQRADREDTMKQRGGYSPAATMNAEMKLQAKKQNQIDAENDFRGPARFSTTYRAFHSKPVKSRGLTLTASNPYATETTQLAVGAPGDSGFSHSVVPLRSHTFSAEEAEAAQPSEEYIKQLHNLPKVEEEKTKQQNQLLDDALFYDKHPDQPRNFATKPPTISQLAFRRPPRATGSEAVPTDCRYDPTGYTLNQRPSLNKPLGSGALEDDGGMGHEFEALSAQQLARTRETDPMEYEYLRNGPKMQSVYRSSFVNHSQAANRERAMRTRQFGGTGGLGASTALYTTAPPGSFEATREEKVGTMRDRHRGLGSGMTIPNQVKEGSGFTSNNFPLYKTQVGKPEPVFLTPQQQTRALSSQKLDFEGDVRTTMYRSDFKSPQQQIRDKYNLMQNTSPGAATRGAPTINRLALPEDYIPSSAEIEPSGFTRSIQPNPVLRAFTKEE